MLTPYGEEQKCRLLGITRFGTGGFENDLLLGLELSLHSLLKFFENGTNEIMCFTVKPS